MGRAESLFEASGGMDGMRRLAAAWHARVMADEVVSHAFSHGFHPQHTDRLAAYWAEALGGPAAYSPTYGDETSVVRMHSGNGVHDEMDRRAIACFDAALADAGLTGDERDRWQPARVEQVDQAVELGRSANHDRSQSGTSHEHFSRG